MCKLHDLKKKKKQPELKENYKHTHIWRDNYIQEKQIKIFLYNLIYRHVFFLISLYVREFSLKNKKKKKLRVVDVVKKKKNNNKLKYGNYIF